MRKRRSRRRRRKRGTKRKRTEEKGEKSYGKLLDIGKEDLGLLLANQSLLLKWLTEILQNRNNKYAEKKISIPTKTTLQWQNEMEEAECD